MSGRSSSASRRARFCSGVASAIERASSRSRRFLSMISNMAAVMMEMKSESTTNAVRHVYTKKKPVAITGCALGSSHRYPSNRPASVW